MRLRAAFEGNLEELVRLEKEAGERSVWRAIKRAGDGAKDDWRERLLGYGMGKRLSRTVRARTYPKSGRKGSFGTASEVFSKADYMHVFEQGTTLKSKDGFYLAIPTENAPKRGVGGKRISPSNWPTQRYGELRFVYRAGKPSLLVADNVRLGTGKRKTFSKASATAMKRGYVRSKTGNAGIATAVMFVLVPKVTMPKVFNLHKIGAAWQAKLPALIAEEWERIAKQLGVD